MSWFKLCDRIPFHRKVIDAGNEAFGAWCRMGAQASADLSDGVVSDAMASLIVGPGREDVLARLVRVRLLERVEGGYLVHDYLEYNPSAAEVHEHRAEVAEARRAAGRVGGQRSGETRRSRRDAREANEASPKQSRSNDEARSEATTKQEAKQTGNQKRSPDPDPDPDPVSRSPAPPPAPRARVGVPAPASVREAAPPDDEPPGGGGGGGGPGGGPGVGSVRDTLAGVPQLRGQSDDAIARLVSLAESRPADAPPIAEVIAAGVVALEQERKRTVVRAPSGWLRAKLEAWLPLGAKAFADVTAPVPVAASPDAQVLADLDDSARSLGVSANHVSAFVASGPELTADDKRKIAATKGRDFFAKRGARPDFGGPPPAPSPSPPPVEASNPSRQDSDSMQTEPRRNESAPKPSGEGGEGAAAPEIEASKLNRSMGRSSSHSEVIDRDEAHALVAHQRAAEARRGPGPARAGGLGALGALARGGGVGEVAAAAAPAKGRAA
jgi:hypothetical protein